LGYLLVRVFWVKQREREQRSEDASARRMCWVLLQTPIIAVLKTMARKSISAFFPLFWGHLALKKGEKLVGVWMDVSNARRVALVQWGEVSWSRIGEADRVDDRRLERAALV